MNCICMYIYTYIFIFIFDVFYNVWWYFHVIPHWPPATTFLADVSVDDGHVGEVTGNHPKMTLIIFRLVRCDQYSPEMLTFCFVMFWVFSIHNSKIRDVFRRLRWSLKVRGCGWNPQDLAAQTRQKTLGQSVQELRDIGFPWDDDGFPWDDDGFPWDDDGFPWDDDGRKKWAAFAWEDHWSLQGLGGWFIPGNNMSGTDGSITNKIKKRETPRNIDIHSFFSHLVAEPYMTQ